MKKIFFILLISLITQYSFSQSNHIAGNELNNPLPEINPKNKTLEINTYELSYNLQSGIREELSSWKEKIISITIDEKNNIMAITHNELMNERDFFDLLLKYGIIKSRIISYQ